MDVRIFAGGGGGRAQRFFRLLRSEAARLVLKLRRWGAAGCPAIGAGRPDKWAEGEKGGGGGHVTRCGGRAHVVLCINSKLAIGWLLFFV
jgi:hypothetical protein